MDLVSVIIPYYKKRNFIKETIISVINQSYDYLEILIIYDDTNLNDLTAKAIPDATKPTATPAATKPGPTF